jgi:hypothetical protein
MTQVRALCSTSQCVLSLSPYHGMRKFCKKVFVVFSFSLHFIEPTDVCLPELWVLIRHRRNLHRFWKTPTPSDKSVIRKEGDDDTNQKRATSYEKEPSRERRRKKQAC